MALFTKDTLQQNIFFFVYGNFSDKNIEIMRDLAQNRWYFVDFEDTNEKMRWPLNQPPMSDELYKLDPHAVIESKQARNAVSVVGQSVGAENAFQNYLDIMQFVDCLASCEGAIAVVDPLTGQIIRAQTWEEMVYAPLLTPSPDLTMQTATIAVHDDNGLIWIRTQGLIKFGQPELSMHNVEEEHVPIIYKLFEKLIKKIVLENKLLPENITITVNPKLKYKTLYAGHYEDDDFWGNVHIELVRE
ncbi:MAG: hypothetical protein WC748_05430 [Legionellales bacterium]|jgi:hypothetical protein